MGKWGSVRSGTDTDRKFSYPVLVDIEQKIKQIICGLHVTAVLTKRGDVYIWGFSRDGKLGVEGITDIFSPEKST